jgi:hypothetical protein
MDSKPKALSDERSGVLYNTATLVNEKAAQVAPDDFFSSGCARRDLVPEGTYFLAIYF